MQTLVSAGGTLEAAFDERAGMLGTSLRHEGEELLHSEGIPLLYPWANRLAAFDYAVLGRQVELDPGSPLLRFDQNDLPIHGLLMGWPQWDVERPDGATLVARLDFEAHEELLRAFPFPHSLQLLVRVGDAELSIETSVVADRDEAVPVSFGYHPYFRLPGLPRDQWAIEIPVREQLVLDDHTIPTGEREPAGDLDGPLGERSFDDAYAGVDHARPFALAGDGRRIEVRFDEHFPFAQVYTPYAAEFICYEPMTAPTNALRSGDHLVVAQPGQTFRATWTVSVTQA
jgi:galactose mutarotase-like enzyme